MSNALIPICLLQTQYLLTWPSYAVQTLGWLQRQYILTWDFSDSSLAMGCVCLFTMGGTEVGEKEWDSTLTVCQASAWRVEAAQHGPRTKQRARCLPKRHHEQQLVKVE
jgi:hypothetical protein